MKRLLTRIPIRRLQQMRISTLAPRSLEYTPGMFFPPTQAPVGPSREVGVSQCLRTIATHCEDASGVFLKYNLKLKSGPPFT